MELLMRVGSWVKHTFNLTVGQVIMILAAIASSVVLYFLWWIWSAFGIQYSVAILVGFGMIIPYYFKLGGGHRPSLVSSETPSSKSGKRLVE